MPWMTNSLEAIILWLGEFLPLSKYVSRFCVLVFWADSEKIREIKYAFIIMKGNEEQSYSCLRKLNQGSAEFGPTVCPAAEVES